MSTACRSDSSSSWHTRTCVAHSRPSRYVPLQTTSILGRDQTAQCRMVIGTKYDAVFRRAFNIPLVRLESEYRELCEMGQKVDRREAYIGAAVDDDQRVTGTVEESGKHSPRRFGRRSPYRMSPDGSRPETEHTEDGVCIGSKAPLPARRPEVKLHLGEHVRDRCTQAQ